MAVDIAEYGFANIGIKLTDDSIKFDGITKVLVWQGHIKVDPLKTHIFELKIVKCLKCTKPSYDVKFPLNFMKIEEFFLKTQNMICFDQKVRNI